MLYHLSPKRFGGVSATIEYAMGVLRVPEVIVCGHTECGVMRGALNPEPLEAYPNVTAWLRYARVEHREPEPSAERLLALTEDNVVAQEGESPLDDVAPLPALEKNGLKQSA